MVEGSYLRFEKGPPKPKTKTWLVRLQFYQGRLTGEIRWFSQWRKYMFFPFGEHGYDHICLRQIADFCEEQTRLHKATWRKRRKQEGSNEGR